MGAIPVSIYLAVFFVVTYPLMFKFSTHFFADGRDGLVMIWNVWWVNKAVTQLHQSPWYTHYMFYPDGVSLFPHTLAPLKGFVAIPLLRFLTLTQTYNLLVVASFVGAGLTAFWLAFYLIRFYWPSLVAGFIFSFSNYHFAHMPGHLNLISVEWIPLFVLFWYILMRKPSVLAALASSLSLFAVILCDYYYFFYCFLIAVVMLLYRAIRGKNVSWFLSRKFLVPLLVFAVTAAASSGVFVFELIRASREDSLVGHEPCVFSADLLSPFVYGGYLRFSHLTEGFWSRLPGNTVESSVFVGVSVIILVIYTWRNRRKVNIEYLGLWYLLLLLFLVNSLGPELHFAGRYVAFLPMPYSLLELLFPPLKLAGVPARMMVVVMLSASLVASVGLLHLSRRSGRARLCAGVLLAMVFFEFLPFQMRPLRVEEPVSIQILKVLPDKGSVLDGAHDPYYQLYYQTIHDKPLAGGHVARVPKRLYDKYFRALGTHVANRDLDKLRRDYEVNYVIAADGESVYDISRRGTYRSIPDSLPHQP